MLFVSLFSSTTMTTPGVLESFPYTILFISRNHCSFQARAAAAKVNQVC
jgi:hypothetical protein